MAEACDILVDIADDDLEELAAIYKNHVNWAPHVFSCIKTGIAWKKSKKYRNSMTFLSPNNSWRKDGTIIVVMEFNCYNIFVFTLDKSCKNLYEGLTHTRRLHFDRRTTFFALYSDHIPTVFKFIKENNFKILIDIPCVSFAIPLEEAKKFDISCLEGVCLKNLKKSNAFEVNSLWPHRYPNSEGFVSALIEMNGGLGLFLTSTNELVAWVLSHCLGILGMLQTTENHLMKGYGSLVTKALSKKMAEEGVTPFGTVLVNNTASQKMFKKIGFREIGTCTYTILEPQEGKSYT